MQLKRESVEAWQNEKHYSNREKYQREPNPKTRNFKQVDHTRSGQVTTFVVYAVFSLSFQAVMLLTKTAINHRFFSIKSEVSGWILEIPTALS